MSTDLQQYSTENQLDKIKRYADQRGFEIVRVFEDAGRSGLTLNDRDGLQDLIRVVQSGAADFEAILVYDVSRWGRFQDADEGAYHEHLCSRAGIRVHYCGEQFDNDGSLGSILLKNVKRVMAGEYASAILAGTAQAQLVNPSTPKRLKGMTAEALARMESELTKLQQAITSIQDSYGQNHLHLTVVKGYLSKLVGNTKITRYLEKHQPDFLSEFRSIVQMTSTIGSD